MAIRQNIQFETPVRAKQQNNWSIDSILLYTKSMNWAKRLKKGLYFIQLCNHHVYLSNTTRVLVDIIKWYIGHFNITVKEGGWLTSILFNISCKASVIEWNKYSCIKTLYNNDILYEYYYCSDIVSYLAPKGKTDSKIKCISCRCWKTDEEDQYVCRAARPPVSHCDTSPSWLNS